MMTDQAAGIWRIHLDHWTIPPYASPSPPACKQTIEVVDRFDLHRRTAMAHLYGDGEDTAHGRFRPEGGVAIWPTLVWLSNRPTLL